MEMKRSARLDNQSRRQGGGDVMSVFSLSPTLQDCRNENDEQVNGLLPLIDINQVLLLCFNSQSFWFELFLTSLPTCRTNYSHNFLTNQHPQHNNFDKQ